MMTKLFLFILLFSTQAFQAQTTSTLFIKSSFDNIIVDKTVSWNHHLSGTDSETGYTFPDDLPGNNVEDYFNYVIGDVDHYYEYANAEIVNTVGFDGNNTNALFLEFIQDDTEFTSYSRVQYSMFGNEQSSNPVERMNQGYIKYRIKTHLDHTDTISDWRIPFELKDIDDDGFRMSFYIYDTNTESPFWVVKGQYMIDGELGDDIWEYDNYDIPVIEDQWFELEVYWYANQDPSLGKFKVAINGELLFDVTNRTKDPDQPNKMFYLMPFKVYGTVGYSWITDFEYWDNPPETSVLYNASASINEQKKHEIQITNPVINYIKLSDNNYQLNYEIIDVAGQLIKKGEVINNTIDSSKLNKGIYFLKLYDKSTQFSQTTKLIKFD